MSEIERNLFSFDVESFAMNLNVRTAVGRGDATMDSDNTNCCTVGGDPCPKTVTTQSAGC
jgi:hypothetical protein